MNTTVPLEAMHSEVAIRAYNIWKRRTGATDQQDWLDAKLELDQVHPQSSRSSLEPRINYEKAAPNIQCRLLELEEQLATAIHEHHQDELRRQTHYAIVHALSRSRSFVEAAPGILQSICAGINWEFGALWVLDSNAEVLRCFALWHEHADSNSDFVNASKAQTFSCGAELLGQAWKRDHSIWIDDLACDHSSTRAQMAAQAHLHSAMAFPIRSGNKFIGVLELLTSEMAIPNDAVLAMLTNTCSNVGDCVERHRVAELLNQHKHERRLAREIQQKLLPTNGVNPRGVTVSGRSEPSSSVGGDYFDYFSMRDGSIGFVVGDASGHGIGAAMMISETRAYLRALALTSNSPSEILSLTNRRLVQDLSDEHFVTLLLVRIDHASRLLQCAGAGHNPGYVLNASGATKAVLTSESVPLGIDSAEDFPIGQDIHLEPDDVIFLYTDGIIEASGDLDEPFGIDRALDCLRSHAGQSLEDMLDGLYSAVRDFSGGSAPADDVTALLIRV